MFKKALLGFGLVLMLAFTYAIPAFASPITEGDGMHAEGTVQSVDTLTGSFTVLTEDGTVVTAYAPEGFDLSLLVIGDTVEVKGTVGLDGLFAADEIELGDGTSFEQDDAQGEDESEVEDQNEGEDETEVEDNDQQEVENDDENSGSDNGGEHDSGGEQDSGADD